MISYYPDIPERKKSTAPTAPWTERSVQDATYIHCAIKNHEIINPNSKLFDWESDLISVTKSGFIHEFEIKITRADFKQDAKKRRATLLCNPEVKGYWGSRVCARPNYFWYVVPKGLITHDEVPEYAGLIYAMKPVVGHHLYFNTTRLIKEAKRIHSEKATEADRRQLARSMTLRFWKQRLRETEVRPELPLVDEREIENAETL